MSTQAVESTQPTESAKATTKPTTKATKEERAKAAKADAEAKAAARAKAKADAEAIRSAKAAEANRDWPCACGCGQTTKGVFFPGHDATTKGLAILANRAREAVALLERAERAGSVSRSADGLWIVRSAEAIREARG